MDEKENPQSSPEENDKDRKEAVTAAADEEATGELADESTEEAKDETVEKSEAESADELKEEAKDEKKEKKKNKLVRWLLLLLLLLLLIFGVFFVGLNWNTWFGEDESSGFSIAGGIQLDTDAEDWSGTQDTTTSKNTDTIDIPGYGSITLQADTLEQSVNFYNPEANTVYFRMSLLLSDGTQLWQSGLIEPGKGIYSITLSQTLEAGTYEEAILKYECFSMDEDQTPLNGSEIKLTLNVIE